MKVRGKKAGGSEQDGLALSVGADLAEGAPGDPLSEEGHGELVRTIAEGACERLPEVGRQMAKPLARPRPRPTSLKLIFDCVEVICC